MEAEHKRRTKQDWLNEAKTAMPKCHWFIVKYFNQKKYDEIMKLIEENNTRKLFDIFNDIWFRLPDSFNIGNSYVMENGWSDFLGLIELWDEKEGDLIFGNE